MTPKKSKSRILDEMRETALGLNRIGLIDKRRMKEIDMLWNLEVGEMTPENIRDLREKEHLSQSVFAAVLNISVSTVQKWEIGEKKPSGPSLKLLNLIRKKGLDVVL